MAVDPTDTEKYPLGSDNLSVLQRNASDLDKVANSTEDTVENRFGENLGTLDYYNRQFQTAVDAIEVSTDEAEGYANDAATSAADAADSALAAAGAANWAGVWDDIASGTAGVAGTSYTHIGYIWLLQENLADVKSIEPGTDGDAWFLTNRAFEYEVTAATTLKSDFANNEHYLYKGFDDTTSGDVTVSDVWTHTRSTSATGIAGNLSLQTAGIDVPRMVFDADTGEGLGYLSEESRTNLLTNSEFPNGLSDAPTRSGLVTLDSMDYGQGDVNAIAFGYDGSTTSAAYKTNFTGVSGSSYVFSVLVQMDDGDSPSFSTTSSFNDFDIVVTGSTLSPETFTTEYCGDSIYRVSAVIVSSAGSSLTGVRKNSTNSSRTFKVTGYQLEEGEFSTSYIPTTTSTLFRGADSMVRTLGDEWNPNEGTFVVDVEFLEVDGGHFVLSESSTRRWLYLSVGNSLISMYDGANQLISNVAAVAGVRYKIAVSSTSSDMKISINGGDAITSTTNGNLLSISNLYIMQQLEGGGNANVRSLEYYNKALSDIELQELTK